jgi:arylformamidase
MSVAAPRRVPGWGAGSIIDITPAVSASMAVFPGDVPFRREVSLDVERGDALTLSAITTTVHLGAHTDAPNHYARGGAGIDARPLELYLGPCQVMTVDVPRGARIRPADLPVPVEAPRVLLHTGSFPDPDRWNGDFNSASPELIEHLAQRGVVLIGIDTPSIDPAGDKVLESHQVVAARDMAILEGIVLDGVADGTYTLVALPLKLRGADAAPVRAVLLADPGSAGIG